jgi:hypothetical protein
MKRVVAGARRRGDNELFMPPEEVCVVGKERVLGLIIKL